MTVVAGGLRDPFLYNELPTAPGYRATKASSNPRPNAAERTFCAVVAGQSMAANSVVGSLYTPTNASKIDNLSPYDGSVLQGNDPAIGTSGAGGSWLFRLADKLITAGIFDRVLLVPVAVTGTSIDLWVPGAALGGNIASAAARVRSLGFGLSAILWQQGESDHGMTQAVYQGKLQSMIDGFRMGGDETPWFIAKSTYNLGVLDAGIRAADVAILNGINIFAGADTDTLTGSTYRLADNVHLNATGADANATLWRNALDLVF